MIVSDATYKANADDVSGAESYYCALLFIAVPLFYKRSKRFVCLFDLTPLPKVCFEREQGLRWNVL